MNEYGYIPIKLLLEQQVVGGIGLGAIICPFCSRNLQSKSLIYDRVLIRHDKV